MGMQEMLTLKVPFHGSNETAAAVKIRNGELPKKPTKEECPSAYLDQIWGMCMRCWAKSPNDRPKITSVIHELVGEQ